MRYPLPRDSHFLIAVATMWAIRSGSGREPRSDSHVARVVDSRLRHEQVGCHQDKERPEDESEEDIGFGDQTSTPYNETA